MYDEPIEDEDLIPDLREAVTAVSTKVLATSEQKKQAEFEQKYPYHNLSYNALQDTWMSARRVTDPDTGYRTPEQKEKLKTLKAEFERRGWIYYKEKGRWGPKWQGVIDKVHEVGEPVAALGLVLMGGIAGIKTATDIYRYQRLTEKLSKLKPTQINQIKEIWNRPGGFSVKDLPKWFKSAVPKESWGQALKGKEFKQTTVRPPFEKLESLFKRVVPPTKDIQKPLAYLFSGPGLTPQQRKELEKGTTPKTGQKAVEALSAAARIRGLPKPPLLKAQQELLHKHGLEYAGVESYKGMGLGEEEELIRFRDRKNSNHVIAKSKFTKKGLADYARDYYDRQGIWILEGKTPQGVLPATFDQKTYDKIKPNLEREWAAFNQAGKSFNQFTTAVMKKYGKQAQSYIDKYRAEDPVQMLITSLKGAKSIRAKQETMYTLERAKRFARAQAVGKKVVGEKGFHTELGALKGEFFKVQFESIRKGFDQENIDKLFIKIANSPALTYGDQLTARRGLAKMFGEFGGRVPTESELKLLNKVYGREFTRAVLANRALMDQLKHAGYQLANIPRSIMASFDMSAPFRQGVFFIGRPKQFAPAFKEMFKYFGSEKAYNALQDDIIKRPSYDLMRKSNLALTELGDTLFDREEAFMSSWAERIPLAGRVIRASGRAHLGFLNKLRADLFDYFTAKAEKEGLDPEHNIDLSRAIANFVNVGTGRGSLGKWEGTATALNTFLFSPRLTASRLTLLNPVYYVTQPPFVRKEALKSLFSFAGIALTVAGLAKLGGAKVETDPRNADFAKIRIRNTRIDLFGGFQQYIRLAAQLISGKIVSSTTGRTYKLGEGYKPLTRLDILQRFVEYKTAPLASFGLGWLRGTTAIGKEFKIPEQIGVRFVPMVMQDAYDIMQEDPSLFPASVLAFFGVGLQTYSGRKYAKDIGLGLDISRTSPLETNMQDRLRRLHEQYSR